MNKSKKRTNHILYLDLLRILATIAVIIIHSSTQIHYNTSPSSSLWQTFNFFNSTVRWAVPIFVMISGALFLDNDKPLKIKKIYTKNILRLITSFFFWSTIYVIYESINGLWIKAIIPEIVKGHYHLWFLPMIISLYILIPILRKITISKKYTEYYLIIGIVFTFLIPNIITLLECIASPNINLLVSAIKSNYYQMTYNLDLGYTVYFVLGFYLAKYDLKPLFRKIIYLLGIIGFLSVFLLSTWYSNKQGTADSTFFNNLSINIMLTSVSVFLFAKYTLSKIKFKEREIKIIKKISKYSFGMYLTHVLVIEVLNKYFNLNILTFTPFTSLIIIVTLVTIISYIISLIINNIPIIKKYIV